MANPPLSSHRPRKTGRKREREKERERKRERERRNVGAKKVMRTLHLQPLLGIMSIHTRIADLMYTWGNRVLVIIYYVYINLMGKLVRRVHRKPPF